MTNKILTLKNTGRLTCTWIATGDKKTPLVCVWTDSKAPSARREASSPKEVSARMLQCA